MPSSRKEIIEVLRTEQARGKRARPDPEKILERQLLLADMKAVLRIRDERTFLKVLVSDYGLQVDSEQYRQALRIWREYQKASRVRP